MLADHLPGLLLAWSILAAGLFGPGPNNLAVADISAVRGRAEGVQLALGLVLGGMVWITAGVLGLSALLSASDGAMAALKAAAALYLVWLAARSFRFALRPPAPAVRAGAAPRRRLVARGMALTLTSPKSALMWMAVVALGLGSAAPSAATAALVAGSAIIATAGHLTYALAFSSAPVTAVYGRWQRGIQATLGLFLCYASFHVLMFRG